MKAAFSLLAAALLSLAASAPAQDRPANRGAPNARPAAFEALVRCRAIADDSARLRCFDGAVSTLQQQAEQRELVVVDRSQIRESRRRLFGLAIPRLPVFGGGSGDDDDAEEVRSIDSQVASATQYGYGRWLVRLRDGSTWAQIDDNVLALPPRPGQNVHVARAALGTFMMRVNNQPAIRVQRRL